MSMAGIFCFPISSPKPFFRASKLFVLEGFLSLEIRQENEVQCSAQFGMGKLSLFTNYIMYLSVCLSTSLPPSLHLSTKELKESTTIQTSLEIIKKHSHVVNGVRDYYTKLIVYSEDESSRKRG